VVTTIWHKAASLPHTNSSIIFVSWRQCDTHTHVTPASLGPPKSTTQTAFWLVKPFFQGSPAHYCDIQTDRLRYSVNNNRPHLHSTALRCGFKRLLYDLQTEKESQQSEVILTVNNQWVKHAFFHSSAFYPTPKILYFSMLFNRPDTLKAQLPMGVYTSPCI